MPSAICHKQKHLARVARPAADLIIEAPVGSSQVGSTRGKHSDVTLVIVAIVVAEEEAVVRSIWADRGDLVVQVTAKVVYVAIIVSKSHPSL